MREFGSYILNLYPTLQKQGKAELFQYHLNSWLMASVSFCIRFHKFNWSSSLKKASLSTLVAYSSKFILKFIVSIFYVNLLQIGNSVYLSLFLLESSFLSIEFAFFAWFQFQNKLNSVNYITFNRYLSISYSHSGFRQWNGPS